MTILSSVESSYDLILSTLTLCLTEYRLYFWAALWTGGLVFVGVAHTILEGDQAWTPKRKEAWKSTLKNTFLSFAIQNILTHTLLDNALYSENRGFWRMFGEFVAFVLLEDLCFYWSHRGLHANKWIYQKVHAYHHTSHKDVSLVNGMQITWIELLLSLIIPGTAPLLFIRMNRIVFDFVIYISVIGVLFDHGLDVFPHFMIPFPLNGTLHHQRHHAQVRGNYSGPLAIWDFLCGTRLHVHQHDAPVTETKVQQLPEEEILTPEQAS